MNFTYRIRDLRRNANLTANELADLCGVSRSAVSQWENGNNQPNNDVLIKLASIFSCSVDYLLGVDDNKTNFKVAFSDYEKLNDSNKKIVDNLAQQLLNSQKIDK